MAAAAAARPLTEHFSALEDPRQGWKVVYPLPEILLIVLWGAMAGAEDFVEIERWARKKLDFLRRLLPFAQGIPPHDTLNDVMNALSAKLFSACFTSWVDGLSEGDADIVAIDGDQGRIEVCRHRVSHDATWLSTDRRFPGEPRFPALAMVGMVEAEVERRGKTSIARRYYLSSAPLSAAQFARAVRAHWGIENRLHWVMDVVFHDDLMRLRTKHGPANMATIRHTALNLIRAIADKASLKVRRKTVAWDDDYLFHTPTQTPQ